MNKTHKDLIRILMGEGIIKNKQVARAMEQVDRQYFTSNSPYKDCPQPIGYGATISAPHMHAYALEFLYDKLKVAKNVLDVGSGTGYLTAAMAMIAPPQSKIFGIEHVPQLVQMSLINISKSNPQLLNGRVVIELGDGREGWVKDNTLLFDVIHVGAAAQKVPQGLISQLAEGGKMVIPVGGQYQIQKFLEIDKIDGKIQAKNICGVRFVPLTDLKNQL